MTPWTAAYQAPPSMGFSRQEYWSGVPLPSLPGTLASIIKKKKSYSDRKGTSRTLFTDNIIADKVLNTLQKKLLEQVNLANSQDTGQQARINYTLYTKNEQLEIEI